MNKQKVLISACLLGKKVRYDGEDNLQTHPRLKEWAEVGAFVLICPEMAGGLPTPRPPSEVEHNATAQDVLQGKAKILTIDGCDVTEQYVKGAQAALELTQQHNIKVAILKARSPSCGSAQVYDGTHSGQLIDGMGVTTALLRENGVAVFNEDAIDEALDLAEFENQ